MPTFLPYLAIALHAISVSLGIAILIGAWGTLRPAKGVHLMWWHVLAITIGVWGWHTLFVLRIISDIRFFGLDFLPGTIPMWYVGIALVLLTLDDLAFWLILKVQRGRRILQKAVS